MKFSAAYGERFRPERELGEGVLGTDFLVTEVPPEGLDQEAVSQVPLVLSVLDVPQRTRLAPEELRRELQALSRLQHANLISPVDLIEPPRRADEGGARRMALLRPFVVGDVLRDFVTVARPPVIALRQREEVAAQTHREEPEEVQLDPHIDTLDLLVMPVKESSSLSPGLLAQMSEDTDEVSLIISEVSRSGRMRAIAPLTERLVRLKQVLPGVLDALDHVHRYKRVHGALSPDCIIIDEALRPHVIGSGLWQMLLATPETSGDQSTPPLDARHVARAAAQQLAAQRPGDVSPELLRGGSRRMLLYRAPELFLSEDRLSPAVDVYSLGCILYELLCGEPPFPLSPDIGRQHLEALPASIFERQPQCPSSWASLIERMMSKEAWMRPSVAELKQIVEQLPEQPTRLAADTRPTPSSFVGRAEQLDAMEQVALESMHSEALSSLLLVGAAGQGKHHMVDHLGARLARHGWLVLRGRCYAQEFEPYQGWKALIEGVLELLEHAPARLLKRIAPARRNAAPLFPELMGEEAPLSNPTQRLEATAALRQLFDLISQERPLLLVMDDIHLAARDTLELLHDLYANDSPFRGLMMATAAHEGRSVLQERDSTEAHEIELRPMTRTEARELMITLTTPELRGVFAPYIESHEHHAPLLLKELVHELQRTPAEEREALAKKLCPRQDQGEGEIARKLRELFERRRERVSDESALILLELLAIHAGPIHLDTLTRAFAASPRKEAALPTLDPLLTQLAAKRLIKRLPTGRRGMPAYRIANELCRALVLSRLDVANRALRYGAMARALSTKTHVSPTQLFEYARRSEGIVDARGLADGALLEARARLAFSLAAEIQSWIVAHHEETGETLRVELAELEAASGQHREAALLWEKMAEGHGPGLEKARALCDASAAWLYAGELERAAQAQEEALRYFGERYTPRAKYGPLLTLKGIWARLFQPPPHGMTDREQTLSPEEALRARIYAMILRTSVMLNTSHMPTFQRRLRRLAERTGARNYLAESYLQYARQLVELDLRRANRVAWKYLEHALELFEEPERKADVHVTRGYLAQSLGEWKQAHEQYTRAEELWRASVTHTRIARVELDYRRGQLALDAGRLDEASKMIDALFYEERHLAPARIRGHQLTTRLALLSGDLGEAQYHLDEIKRLKAKGITSLLMVWHTQQSASLHIARGEPEVALGLLDIVFEKLADDPLFRAPRVRAGLLRQLTQTLCAQLTHDFYTDRARRGDLMHRLKITLHALRRLKGQLTPLERAAMERLIARQDWLRGRPKRALRLLDEAILDDELRVRGPLEQAMFTEARSQLLDELEQPGALELSRQAQMLYEQLAVYAPLVLEGWPVWEERAHLKREGSGG